MVKENFCKLCNGVAEKFRKYCKDCKLSIICKKCEKNKLYKDYDDMHKHYCDECKRNKEIANQYAWKYKRACCFLCDKALTEKQKTYCSKNCVNEAIRCGYIKI